MNNISRNDAYKQLNMSLTSSKNKLGMGLFSWIMRREGRTETVGEYKLYESLRSELATNIFKLKSAEKRENTGFLKRWLDRRKIREAEKIFDVLNEKMSGIFRMQQASVLQYQKEKIEKRSKAPAAAPSEPVKAPEPQTKGVVKAPEPPAKEVDLEKLNEEKQEASQSKESAEQKLLFLERDHASQEKKLKNDINFQTKMVHSYQSKIFAASAELAKVDEEIHWMECIEKGGQELQDDQKKFSEDPQKRAEALKLINLCRDQPEQFRRRKEEKLNKRDKLLGQKNDAEKLQSESQEEVGKLSDELQKLNEKYTSEETSLKETVSAASEKLEGVPKGILSDQDKEKCVELDAMIKEQEPKVLEKAKERQELEEEFKALVTRNTLCDQKYAIYNAFNPSLTDEEVVKSAVKISTPELVEFAHALRDDKNRQNTMDLLNKEAVEISGALGRARKAFQTANQPFMELEKLKAERARYSNFNVL